MRKLLFFVLLVFVTITIIQIFSRNNKQASNADITVVDPKTNITGK